MAIVVYSWEADQEKSKHFVDCELALQNFNMSAHKKVNDVSNLRINNSSQNENTPVGDVIDQTDLNDDASPNLGKSWKIHVYLLSFMRNTYVLASGLFNLKETKWLKLVQFYIFIDILFLIRKHSHRYK